MASVIEVSIPVAAMLMVAFLACVLGFGRVLLRQFELRVSERLDAVDKQIRKEQAQFQELRREVSTLVRNLPIDYVRREDWIRFSTVIDTKLDRLLEAFHKSQQSQQQGAA